MKRCGFHSNDIAHDRILSHYTDQLGRQWIAQSPWSLQRERRHNDFW